MNELMEKSMTELRELAKSMDIKSYYKFRKDELVNEILKRIQEAKIAQGIIPPPPKEEKLEEEMIVKRDTTEKPLSDEEKKFLES
ncbi:MAG TPA: Rho termination factor N-terminal domain-containing protein, partial [Bacillota bacterium]|nr:Rho termination factor N-terminal domain-containing protein [Bacillota bacterium]